jgi:hypothetical protein
LPSVAYASANVPIFLAYTTPTIVVRKAFA